MNHVVVLRIPRDTTCRKKLPRIISGDGFEKSFQPKSGIPYYASIVARVERCFRGWIYVLHTDPPARHIMPANILSKCDLCDLYDLYDRYDLYDLCDLYDRYDLYYLCGLYDL